jgi:hypothetical protein
MEGGRSQGTMLGVCARVCLEARECRHTESLAL